MIFKLDNGRFPKLNPNRILARSRKVMAHPSMNPTLTQQKSKGVYDVCQYMNSPIELQIKNTIKPKDGSRRGFI